MKRTLDTRFQVLRDGAYLTELRPAEGATPTIRMDGKAELKSSLSGVFVPNEQVDWLRDELQAVAVIDGVEHAFGVFQAATFRPDVEDGVKTITVEAYDRCWCVFSTRTESVLHLSAGANYISTVRSLLATAGITLISSTDSSATLRTAREDWGIGESYLTIVNQLLDEINYKPLWFDAAGVAVLEPEPLLTPGAVKRTYDGGNVSSLMLPRLSEETDLYNAPNVFICVCSNPDDRTPMVATAVNSNPLSPLSTARRGRRIAQVYKLNNIASAAALQEYADLLCQENMLLGETISFQTAILPDCGVNEAVALLHPEATGLCQETAWTVEFVTGGTMTHTLERTVLTL